MNRARGGGVGREVPLAEVHDVQGVELLDAELLGQLVSQVVLDTAEGADDLRLDASRGRGDGRAALVDDADAGVASFAGPAGLGVAGRRGDEVLAELRGIELVREGVNVNGP